MTLVRAAVNATGAIRRRLGMSPLHPHWEARAAVCETCALRVIQCGVSYCGKPYLQQIERDEAVDGCGCPCREKAKAPQEHCPITTSYVGVGTDADEACGCKWCMRASPVLASTRSRLRDIA